MTDSDWAAFENKLRVTWYEKNPKTTVGCSSCQTKEHDIYWIDAERNGNYSIFLCEICITIMNKLIDIIKSMPKAEKQFDKSIDEENQTKVKEKGIHVIRNPNIWMIPQIQRRFLLEELV